MPVWDADPERVVEVTDEDAGLEAYIAIDSVREELTAGGIRRARYPDAEAAREEAAGLARAMTLKCRAAEVPSGGAKTVVVDRDDLDVEAAYRALGEAIDDLEPAYLGGPDLGTGPDEIAHVREVTDRVNPEANEPGRSTAVGVLAGVQAAREATAGTPSPSGARVLVQGYGAVGRRVARGLLDQGAIVLVAETDDEARQRAEETGLTTVDPDAWHEQDVDVVAPCATGGVVTEEVAEQLDADAVCGSANNPLAGERAAEVLHERGIVYAPDVIVNGGAIVEGVLTWREGRSKRTLDQVQRRLAGVYERTLDVLETADREDVPPTSVVRRRWGSAPS